jgi:hypothetical protein
MLREQLEDHQALLTKVTKSRQKAERIGSRLQTANVRLIFVSLSSSAACTLAAGITAANGPLIGEGSDGWRLACITSAVLSFVATLFIGLSQHLRIGDRLSMINQCLGRLRSLDVIITTGSRPLDDVIKEYAEIAEAFPECID